MGPPLRNHRLPADAGWRTQATCYITPQNANAQRPLDVPFLRRALVLSRGDYPVFVTRPMSLAMLVLAAAPLVVVVAPSVRKQREAVFTEDS